MAGSGTYGFRLAPDQIVKAEIVGLREVQRDLRKLGNDTKTEMKETHKQAAEVVVMGAKRLVPYRTGALAASIRALATQSSGRVRAGSASVPYAGPIHFGWPARGITPNPFIYDAVDSRVDEIKGLYAERIDQLINKYDLASGKPLRQARAVRATAGFNDTGNLPDALLRNTAGDIIGGVYGDKVVRF